MGAAHEPAWDPRCDRDRPALGRYLDGLAAALRCAGDSYCHDECNCQAAAAIACAANPSTATYLDTRCCHDPGDCADVCGAARPGAAGDGT